MAFLLHARNSFALARRHGRPGWTGWHLAFSARHLQLANGGEQRRAILHGLWDGALGRMGEHPRYGRRSGSSTATAVPGLAPGDHPVTDHPVTRVSEHLQDHS